MRRLALRAYATYARYLVELMRLPRLSQAAGGGPGRRRSASTSSRSYWRASKGVILVVCHVGSNEVVAAGVATAAGRSRSWPTTRPFRSSSRSSGASANRGASTVIPWRNLREVYGVLRRHELLALLVDWGYREDGIPVPLLRCLDHPPGRAGGARRQDRRLDPADHDPAPAQRPLPGRARQDRSPSRRTARPTSSGRRRRSPTALERTRSGRHPSSGTASSRCGRRPRPRPRRWPPEPSGWPPTSDDEPSRASELAPRPPGGPAPGGRLMGRLPPARARRDLAGGAGR